MVTFKVVSSSSGLRNIRGNTWRSPAATKISAAPRSEETFSAPAFVHVETILKGSPSTAQRKRSATLETQDEKNSINSEGVAQKPLLAFEETSGNNYGRSEAILVALFQSARFFLTFSFTRVALRLPWPAERNRFAVVHDRISICRTTR